MSDYIICINRECKFRDTCYSAIAPEKKPQKYAYFKPEKLDGNNFPDCYSYSTEEEQKAYQDRLKNNNF